MRVSLPTYVPASQKKKTKVGGRGRPFVLSYLGEEKINEPVKYTISSKDIPFHLIRSDAKDLLFIDAAGQIIPYWIESVSSDKIDVFLKFPRLSKSLVPFWVYYGNKVNQGISRISAAFKYRRKITITEQSGNDLSDYQVRIDLDSTNFDFSHFLNEGKDLRFTDTSGNLLPYWIEKMDIAAEKATIWVNVPSIPANSSVDIYMYYGSSSVPSASDCDAVFIFADDGEKKGVVCKYYPAGLSTAKPAIIEGKKFLVTSTGFWTPEGDCYVVECDDDWNEVSSYKAPFTPCEVYVPSVADTMPGKLIFVACGAILSLFDINTKTFDYVQGTDRYWIDLKKIGDYYYLLPGLNLYFYKFHKDDILNMDNWIKINTPEPSQPKKEMRMAVFNNYLYLLRFHQTDYPFSIDLIRYNPETDTFETIIPETGDTTDVSSEVFPYIFSDDSKIVLPLPRSTPTYHWDIMLSNDGVNFTTIAEEEMIDPSHGNELHCHVFIINDKIYVMQVQDEFQGHISVYDLDGTLLIRDWANITTHDTENCYWIDGDFAVIGGETIYRSHQPQLKFVPTDYTKLSEKWTYAAKEGQASRLKNGKQKKFGLHVFNLRYENMFPVSRDEMPTICEASAWVCPRSSDTGSTNILLRAAENERTWYEAGIESGGKFKIGRVLDGSYTELASTSVEFLVDVWRKIVIRTIDSTIIGRLYDENMNLIAELEATDTNIASGRAGFGSWSYADVDFDCFIVRKITEPEPAVSVGNEKII